MSDKDQQAVKSSLEQDGSGEGTWKAEPLIHLQVPQIQTITERLPRNSCLYFSSDSSPTESSPILVGRNLGMPWGSVLCVNLNRLCLDETPV